MASAGSRIANAANDMRKNARYHEGHEHCRNEHHPIEHGGRAELSSAGTTAEYVEPSNDGYRHTNHTEERTLVSDEWPIHEDRLHRAGPNNSARPPSAR